MDELMVFLSVWERDRLCELIQDELEYEEEGRKELILVLRKLREAEESGRRN